MAGLKQRIEETIALQRAKKFDAAREAYAAILTEAPDDPDALHFCGVLHYQTGEPDKAEQLIRRSLEIKPGQPGALTNLANVLKLVEREDEAYACLVAALELDPSHADAWCNAGVLLRRADRLEESAEALRAAVTIIPDHGEAWHNLGLTEFARGDLDAAVEAFRTCYENPKSGSWADPAWYAQLLCVRGARDKAEAMLVDRLRRTPDDPILEHQLAAVRGEDRARAPDDYVRNHFDRFSESFDVVLKRLNYRAPEIVAERVAGFCEGGGKVPAAVDLGCGTGLVGPLIRPHCARLVGVDLSPGMLQKAARRRVYDHLVEAEITRFVTEGPEAGFELAVSVDTLIYFGVLDDVFAGLTRCLKRGGLFIATFEGHEGEGFEIENSGRYRHSEAYLRQVAGASGLKVISVESEVLRKELGKPVEGLVMAALNG